MIFLGQLKGLNVWVPKVSNAVHCTSVRGIKMFEPPEDYGNWNLPSRTRLPQTTKVPQLTQEVGIKYPKKSPLLHNMRGEELHHNELVLKQFGIIALGGGSLQHKHFEMLRQTCFTHLRKLKDKGFAIYRVDAPNKPVTRKGPGKKHGGGKANIAFYVTQLKAGRVILEVGGNLYWDQVYPWLSHAAEKLPFKAIAVDYHLYNKLNEEQDRLDRENENPYTMEWMIRNNIMDCQRQLSPYDKRSFGKFVYKDRTLNIKWNQILKQKYTHHF